MIDQSVARPPSTATAAPVQSGGSFRWVICALLFFAATINYIDRQVIGILKPTLQAEFGWSEIDYADIVFAFQLAYAAGFLVAGRVMDWLGVRLGFTIVPQSMNCRLVSIRKCDAVTCRSAKKKSRG